MTSNSDELDVLLATLRDTPVNNEGVSNRLLERVYSYLMGVPATSSGIYHWFCDQASPTTIAAASFLIRLFAYDGSNIEVWKGRFHGCLSRCASCVQKVEEVKVTSRTTYFGAFPEETLQIFYDTFENWELQSVMKDLTDAGFEANSPSLSDKTLAEAPASLVYRMLANWTIFSDIRIQEFISKCVPSRCFSGWPTREPPAGVLILLMHDSVFVREWIRKQCAASNQSLISNEHFTWPYIKALEAISNQIQLLKDVYSEPSFPFAKDPTVLWSGFNTVLRLLPIEVLISSPLQSLGLRHVVTGHLHDTGTHFPEVLRSLFLLLKRLSKDFWASEDPAFPRMVFDSVKDNASFSSLLPEVHISENRLWVISWIPEFLYTVQEHSIYGEILAKVTDFLCEEVQHERFRDARPLFMNSAIQLLISVFRKYQADERFRHAPALLNALDIHAGIMVDVAYGRQYENHNWENARISARTLVNLALTEDIEQIVRTISRTCHSLAQLKKGGTIYLIPFRSHRRQMWRKLYVAIHTNDITAIASVIVLVSKASHLDTILKASYDDILRAKSLSDIAASANKGLDQVNTALGDIRSGFIDLISRFADYSISTSALDVLRCPDVGKAITMLLLSPIHDFQVAAQTLIGLAFDVDVRLDCFRAMLVNLPDATLDGIFHFLSKFNIYAPQVPEACALSKSLVRCFNDILEVLCATPDGFLRRPDFLRAEDPNGPASRMLEFWKLLTTAITIIFKRTVSWAVFYKSSEMVDWMRDAIILGRDILKEWRTIENAANSATEDTSSQSTRRLSKMGEKMVASFQEMLPELARWLRLTDEELLYQAFAILQTLLEIFNQVNIRPLGTSLTKLSKYVGDARADRTKSKSRLDSASLSKLEDALAVFNLSSSDQEIEIISHTLPPKLAVPSATGSSKAKEKSHRLYIHTDKPDFGSRGAEVKHAPVAQSTGSKAPWNKYLQDAERVKLNVEVVVPSFRQQARSASSSSSLSKSKSLQKTSCKGPKNEAVAGSESSNDSESSDSESEQEIHPGVGLSALGRLPKSPKIKKKEGERRRIKTLDISMQRNPIQERLKSRMKVNNQNAAYRLRPDISGLHRVILSWKYDHDGPLPPGERLQLVKIPSIFNDYNQYRRIFEPLLLLECWSQIVRSKDESQDSYSCKVASRQYVSDWLDIYLSITESVTDGWNLVETDIVLLCHPSRSTSIMAKTLSFTKQPKSIVIGARCFIQGSNVDPGLQIGTIWRISKIFSLSTIHREYGALIALPYINLYDCVLSPRLSKIRDVSPRELQNTMTTYNLNKPQAAAVLNTMATDGFALIQGPPGTGKTSTICALVAHFVSQRPRPIQVPGKKEEKVPKAKILLCAPSNAAIDEVAFRLKIGFCGPEKGTKAINVVRIGASQAISDIVVDISLDRLVEQKLGIASAPHAKASDEIKALYNEMASLKQLREEKLQELTNVQDSIARRTALERDAQTLRSRRQELATKINSLKDQMKSDSRTLDGLRRQVRREVLQDADVVCSTLSGSGHESLVDHEFEMVIIDEAAQAIELSSLIPLKYNCARCIMVGDPRQLPPTVLSQEATRHRYDQSLFVRLHNQCPESVNLLSIQYRMHPEISRFPSQIFYQGRIEDGPNMDELTARPWHKETKFGIYKFFNIPGMEQQTKTSIKNVAECHVARALYRYLITEFSKFDFTARVGIVTMYRAQLHELRLQFIQEFGSKILNQIDFNTVDGFQGQEKDVIILSCVRAGPGLQSVGFLSDVRRMNVAITRAKSSLFILGNAPTLERSDETWRQIVVDARNRSALVNADTGYFSKSSPPVLQSNEPSRKKARLDSVAQLTTLLPSDLVTPKELKNSVGKRSLASTTKGVSEVRNGTEKKKIETPQIGIKRNADAIDGSHAPSPQISAPSEGSAKTLQPPPVKRTKTQTMFIPKKSNKKV